MNSEKINITPADPDCIRVIQITDTHILPADHRQFKGMDTALTLAQVIAAINADVDRPDLILATGDLVHDPLPEVYERLRCILQQANYPVFCLPGNHDQPELMHSMLNGGRLSTARLVVCGAWQLLLLNTMVPGSERGYLSEVELRFLKEQLQHNTHQHSVIALHHPPVDVGSPWMDAMKISNGEEFLAIIRRMPQVRCVLWGHVHQEFRSQLEQIQLIGTPSTCMQFKPNTLQFEKDVLPPAYRKLTLQRDGRVITSLHWLEEPLAHDSVSWD